MHLCRFSFAFFCMVCLFFVQFRVFRHLSFNLYGYRFFVFHYVDVVVGDDVSFWLISFFVLFVLIFFLFGQNLCVPKINGKIKGKCMRLVVEKNINKILKSSNIYYLNFDQIYTIKIHKMSMMETTAHIAAIRLIYIFVTIIKTNVIALIST